MWQRFSRTWPLSRLIGVTFILEIVLVVNLVAVPEHHGLLLILGVANGVYNAFFWTTQRTLFIELLGSNDSGRQYGNFQIFVGVTLKAGILLGGLLLDVGGLPWLLGLSTLIALAGLGWFWLKLPPASLQREASIDLRRSLRRTDAVGSKPIFSIDGVFLFLESHFWTLSLFHLVGEDYSRLGLIVVVLAILFAVIFYYLKNSIDRFTGHALYTVSVALYSVSWLLRAFVNENMPTVWLLSLLLIITFCSSFFRLMFNKQFFDNARQADGLHYLLAKSYISQFWLGWSFLLLAILLWWQPIPDLRVLMASYIGAALLAWVYLQFGRTGNQSGH